MLLKVFFDYLEAFFFKVVRENKKQEKMSSSYFPDVETVGTQQMFADGRVCVLLRPDVPLQDPSALSSSTE